MQTYSLEQFQAAEDAARQYLQDRADEPGRQAPIIDFDRHKVKISGTIDLGELITAALDAACA